MKRILQFLSVVLFFAPTPLLRAESSPAFRVQVHGSGRPMILIPGLSSSGEVWDSTVARYQSQYRCYVLTLAGFAGQPRWNGPGDEFLNAVRDQLAAFIDKNNLNRPVIVGHSLGGFLALSFAEKYPEKTGSLVIVDSLPFLAHAWFDADSPDAVKPMAANMRKRISEQTDEDYANYVNSGASTRMLVTGDTDFRRIQDWGLHSDKQTVGDALYDMMLTDLRPDLGKIHSPILVMGSWIGLSEMSQQAATPAFRATIQKEFEDQYAHAAQSKIVLDDHARHFIMYDDPQWYFTQVDAFLKAFPHNVP